VNDSVDSRLLLIVNIINNRLNSSVPVVVLVAEELNINGFDDGANSDVPDVVLVAG
jgi:hypothetical protein